MGNAKFRNNVHVICKLHLNIKFGTHKKFPLWVPQRKHNLEVGMQRFLTLWIPVSQFILSSGTRLPHGSLSSGDKIPRGILSPPRIFCPQGQNTMATVSCPRGKDTLAVVSFPPSCFGYFCFCANFFCSVIFSSFNRLENLYFVIVLWKITIFLLVKLTLVMLNKLRCHTHF